MFINNTGQWANEIFGSAQLNDPRRTKRLVKIVKDMTTAVDKSIAQASLDPASIEGAYRFMRNDCIDSENIAQAGYKRTDELVENSNIVLAIQDTTELTYKHSVCKELGNVSTANHHKPSKKRTILVHSTLMIDAEQEHTIGLANQHYWVRQEKVKGTPKELAKRDKTEKESYKWERNISQLSERLSSMQNVIDVCDREADMYEYLSYQISHNNRFVVRAKENRCLLNSDKKLLEQISQAEPCGYKKVNIAQRGGKFPRKTRTAELAISYTSVTLKAPQTIKDKQGLKVTIIQCQEINSQNEDEKLCWNLYTTEQINNAEDAKRIVRFYELRWRIEEFHKVWKSDGTKIESSRLQTLKSIQRIAIIKAFIAVRIFQVRELMKNNKAAEKIVCTDYVSPISWKILWKTIEKKKTLPSSTPSLYWLYYAIAKLGGWYDSKGTGKVGLKTFWEGWMKLMNLVEAYEMLQSLNLE